MNRQVKIIDENGIEIPVDGIANLSKGDIFRLIPTDENDPVNPKQAWKATSTPLIDLDGQWIVECRKYSE